MQRRAASAAMRQEIFHVQDVISISQFDPIWNTLKRSIMIQNRMMTCIYERFQTKLFQKTKAPFDPKRANFLFGVC